MRKRCNDGHDAHVLERTALASTQYLLGCHQVKQTSFVFFRKHYFLLVPQINKFESINLVAVGPPKGLPIALNCNSYCNGFWTWLRRMNQMAIDRMIRVGTLVAPGGTKGLQHDMTSSTVGRK